MKKLILFIVLAIAAPVFAMSKSAISEADYQTELQNVKNALFQKNMSNFNNDPIRAQRAVDYLLATDDDILLHFAVNNNMPVVDFLLKTKRVNPIKVVDMLLEGYDALTVPSNVKIINYLLDNGTYTKADLEQVIYKYTQLIRESILERSRNPEFKKRQFNKIQLLKSYSNKAKEY